MMEKKVIVIGIDAASWDAILPYISKLPTFRMFIEKGCWGHLESCIPPVTFPAWKCYSTGKSPGKLGVYWWIDIDWDNQRFIIHNSKSFHDKEIWDYLGEYGYKVGIINMPTTYPPKKVNGFCIAGMPAEDDTEYTYPKALKEELIEKFDYRIHPKNNVYIELYGKSEREKILNEIFKLIELRFKVAKYFIDDLDFLHLTIFYSDFIHHFFGNDSEMIYKLYKKIDDELKKLITTVDLESTYIVLMSDHGQKVFKYTFQINEWLRNEGYLFTKNIHKLISLFGKLVNIDNIIWLIDKLKLKFILNYIPNNVKRKFKLIIPRKFGFDNMDIINIIDLEKSYVIALDYVIYINKNLFSSKREYDTFRRKLISKLKIQRSPFNNETLFEKIFLKEEIYPNAKGNPPDIFFIPKFDYHVFCGIGNIPNEKIWIRGSIDDRWTSNHTLYGIFGVVGPDIREGYIINPRIVDLAPTILHIFNLPIPHDIDGRVLKEIFKENSPLAKRKVKYEDPLKAKIKRAVRNLKLGGKI